MAYLTCSNCNHMLKAIHISTKIMTEGEQRNLEYSPKGIKLSDWIPVSSAFSGKEEGVYCPSCKSFIDLDPEELPFCEDTRISGISAVEFSSSKALEKLKALAVAEEAEIFVQTLAEKEAIYAPIPDYIPTPIQNALLNMGISQLYIHQAQAAEAVDAGKNVVLSTSTSSGKTLSYNLPILSQLYKNPLQKALYIFPTKALANDQLEQIKRFSLEPDPNTSLLDAWFEAHLQLSDQIIHVGRLDGDTEDGPRQRIMKEAQIWMTNPDMLHFSILGQVQKLKGNSGNHIRHYLQNLKFIVLDEMHMYRGTFGSHVALVLRRLLKVCKELGNKEQIQMITSSATIENPCKLAEDLSGVGNFTLIEADGSAHKRKEVILWNPGLAAGELVRKAPSTEAIAIAKHVMTMDQKVIKSIIFQPSRAQTMIFTRYIKDVLRQPSD